MHACVTASSLSPWWIVYFRCFIMIRIHGRGAHIKKIQQYKADIPIAKRESKGVNWRECGALGRHPVVGATDFPGFELAVAGRPCQLPVLEL